MEVPTTYEGHFEDETVLCNSAAAFCLQVRTMTAILRTSSASFADP